MKVPRRTRYRLEVALAIMSVALLALTLVYPQWIEVITGLEPDAGSGALELAVAGAFLVAAITSALLAHRDRRVLGRSSV